MKLLLDSPLLLRLFKFRNLGLGFCSSSLLCIEKMSDYLFSLFLVHKLAIDWSLEVPCLEEISS